MRRSAWRVCVAMLVAASVAAPAAALVKEGGNYDAQTKVEPDAGANGWFINLGITGARGRMSPEAPTVMEVAYVFARTPAYGRLAVGDKIVGANGRPFTTPHKFGYGMDTFGYEGPMMDIGNALEQSQGPRLKGKLRLDVIRGGKRKRVELKLPTKYGRFAKAYPYECRKSDRILEELYAYLLSRQRGDGTWTGRPHVNTFAALALLASGRREHVQAARKAMWKFGQDTDDVISYGGLDCWKYGLYGVALSEYYLATGDEWVVEELDEINRWLLKSQFIEHCKNGAGKGGWGHRPRGRPGGNGYGPICIITAQAMTAWSLMAGCGIEVDPARHAMAHEFLVKATNNIGYVWYSDGNGGDNKYADMGRTGASAVAHATSPFGGAEYFDLAMRHASCIGENTNTFPDTHGSPILGMGWTALGAAVDAKALRSLMDDHVWFFNLSHCPDGTFYYQPNRDGNSQDYGNDPRLCASAATALILSIKFGSLSVMGARQGIPGFDQRALSARTRPVYGALCDREYGRCYDAVEKLLARASTAGADREVLTRIREHIHGLVDASIAGMERLAADGDVVKLEAAIARAYAKYPRIARFTSKVKPLAASLRRNPGRAELGRGKTYYRMLAKAESRGAEGDIAALERFARLYPKSFYGKAAAEAAARLREK